MFKENNSFKKTVEETASFHIRVPEKWRGTEKPYSFCPRDIRVSFNKNAADGAPIVFICYFTLENGVLTVSRFAPAPAFATSGDRMKGIVDAYINKVFRELIRHASLLSAKKIVIESALPAAADSFLDLGFKAKMNGENLYVGEYKVGS